MTVVDSTLADPARAVARSTARSGRVDGSADGAGSAVPPEDVQAVPHASATVTAITTTVRLAPLLLAPLMRHPLPAR
ncbi:hypothetical protein GCM10010308_33770 [Streptomyces vinaceusdrappus]|nr:hypothetical protein GCM10010308_33770 [Streptomyces vinaceusdrappus]